MAVSPTSLGQPYFYGSALHGEGTGDVGVYGLHLDMAQAVLHFRLVPVCSVSGF